MTDQGDDRNKDPIKLLILKTPYNEKRGIGVPDSDYDWLAGLYRDYGLDVLTAAISDIEDLQATLEKNHPDIVLCTAYDVSNGGLERLIVHHYLDTQGIPYIGSSTETLELAIAKYKLKESLKDAGIATPGYFLYREGAFLGPGGMPADAPANFPYLLKPGREGNSRGIDENSIVWDGPGMVNRLHELSEVYPEILVEEYLGDDPDLREYTVAMIGNPPHRKVLPARIKLLVNHPYRIITTKDKMQHHTEALIVVNQERSLRVRRLAEAVFETVEARDYARCDLILAHGRLQVIEVNGQPMIPDLWFDACAESAGMSRSDYCLAILCSGLARALKAGVPSLPVPERLKPLMKKITSI
jgi:D-alanine-D-alanine ligase-like ATP-grasp enzyme